MSRRTIRKVLLLIKNRDGKDPKALTEQILAIAPILPGQKVKSDFEIPPHASSTTLHHGNDLQQGQTGAAPSYGGGNDLMDFGDPASNVKAVAANQNNPSQPRTRSVSLMDDDRHLNAMNDKMENMNLMGSLQASGQPSPGKQRPLARTDTETSEVDAFFDAEG